MNSRYYNPEWGRYLNVDALGGSKGELLSHNMFVYCKNNPVNNVDPNGYFQISIFSKINQYVFAVALAIVAVINYNVNRQIKPISNSISGTISSYQTKKKEKAKSKTVANTSSKSESSKTRYWEANYNKQTKNIDIGLPISRDQAMLRVASNQSIMAVNYNSAKQIAMKFPGPELEINVGTYGTEGYYPHFHIRGRHGDPHIWFYIGN